MPIENYLQGTSWEWSARQLQGMLEAGEPPDEVARVLAKEAHHMRQYQPPEIQVVFSLLREWQPEDAAWDSLPVPMDADRREAFVQAARQFIDWYTAA